MEEYRDIIEQLIRYSNVYAAVYSKEMHHGTDIPFSYAQIQVVEYLLENEDLNQNMNTIATRLGITNSTFSKLASRLVKKGLLQKYHAEGNRKDVIIRVTETGRRVYDEYSRHILKHHFSLMFEQARDIPREWLPHFARMLGAGLPREMPQRKETKPVLIPIDESKRD